MSAGWKYIFVLFCSMFFGLNLYGQNDSTDDSSNILINPATYPVPGPSFSFEQFLKDNLKIPAHSNCSEGIIYVQITIDSLGFVRDPVIKKGLCQPYNEEALRLVSIMPRWIPGKWYDEPKAFKMMVPIKFKLEK